MGNFEAVSTKDNGQKCTAWMTRSSRPSIFLMLSLVAVFVVVGVIVVLSSRASTPPPLSFDLPASSTLRSSSHQVFAHYFTPLAISADNQPPSSDYYARNLLNPHGLVSTDYPLGRWFPEGGLFRERPLPRDPITNNAGLNSGACPMASPGWRLDDMETEVRRAISAGIDGFTLDVLQLPADPALGEPADIDVNACQHTFIMLQAAQAVDPNFKIIITLDMSGSLSTRSQQRLANFTAQLATYKSAYHLSDGRLVVVPVFPERLGHDGAWWKVYMDELAAKGIKVALVPCFLNISPDQAATSTSPFIPGTLKDYAPISYGFSNWGSRNPGYNTPTNLNKYIDQTHALGKIWMQPVSIQDERPNQHLFDEANNTENLRATWNAASTGGSKGEGAEWVQLVTWNDYSEGAETAPSTHIGWGPLDISSYYLTRFKSVTKAFPTIVRDVLYVSHRIQFADAKPDPSSGNTALMINRRFLNGIDHPGSASPSRDKIEVLSFLTSPGTIEVTINGAKQIAQAPAGMTSTLFDLQLGSVTVRLLRNTAVLSVTSPFPVVAAPFIQDEQYHFVSSGRSGILLTTPFPPTIVPTPIPTPTPTPTSPSTPTPTPSFVPAPSTTIMPTPSVSPTTVSPSSDINGDGKVNASDLSSLLSHYGSSSATKAQGDINGDGKVTITDLSTLLKQYGL